MKSRFWVWALFLAQPDDNGDEKEYEHHEYEYRYKPPCGFAPSYHSSLGCCIARPERGHNSFSLPWALARDLRLRQSGAMLWNSFFGTGNATANQIIEFTTQFELCSV